MTPFGSTPHFPTNISDSASLLPNKSSPIEKMSPKSSDTPEPVSLSCMTRFTKSFAPVKNWFASNWKPLLAVLIGLTVVAAGVLSGGTSIPLSLGFLVAASSMLPGAIGSLSSFAGICYGFGSMCALGGVAKIISTASSRSSSAETAEPRGCVVTPDKEYGDEHY